MNNSFKQFLNHYLDVWRRSSLIDLSKIISKEYQAREITKNEIVDFGYEESIKGWQEGFHFVKENNAQWILNEIATIPLREDEMLVIVSASMIIQGELLQSSNLFFQTFKQNNKNEWKLVRSYIEAGIYFLEGSNCETK